MRQKKLHDGAGNVGRRTRRAAASRRLPVGQLLNLLENSSDPVVILDPGYHILYANKAAVDHVRGNSEQMIGRHHREALAHLPHICDLWEPRIDAVIRTGKSMHFSDCVDMNGTSVWSEAIVSPIRQRDGRIWSVGIVYRNITERVLALQQLRESEETCREGEERFARLLASLDDVIWSVSLEDNKLLYVNAATERVYGRRLEEFFADEALWTKVIHPEDVEKGRQVLTLALEHGVGEGEYRIIRPDGQIRWLRDRKYVIRNSAGRATHIVGIATDITEARATAEALHESEQRFRSLVEQAIDGVMSIDRESLRITFANRAMCQMTGYSEAELLALSIDDLFPLEQMAQVCEAFLDLGESHQSTELTIIRKDGSTMHTQVNPFLISLQGKTHVAGFFRDLTQLDAVREREKWYRHRLRSLSMEVSLAEERERRRLGAMLHDEVWQILSLAEIRLSLLQREKDRAITEQASEVRKLISRAAHATRALTMQMSHPALYDLGLAAAAELLAEDIEHRFGLGVTMKVDEGIEADDVRIRVVMYQSLRELLLNVAKHSGSSHAWVTICADGPNLVLSVADRGKGFALESLAGVPVNGFGLFCIRERLMNLGGRMEVTSRPDEGTIVTLVVPNEPGE